MSVTVKLDTDGPRDPAYTREVSSALAECVRVLNHLTRDHGALADPADADRLIGDLASAVIDLPQLFEQVTHWFAAEQQAGNLVVASGSHVTPGAATSRIAVALREAYHAAPDLWGHLQRAASVASDLARSDP
jgi:hypothetical protein